jgi:nitroreductase
MDALVTAFRERRSARIYDDRHVSRELVNQLVDAARWVPSAGNGQPVDWLAFDDRERIAALSAQTVAVLAHNSRLVRDPAHRSLLVAAHGAEQVRRRLQSADSFERLARRHKEGEDPIFHRAPILLIAHTPVPSSFGRDDATYAAYNLMLAAERLGLGTCQIGYFQIALDLSKELRHDLGLPAGRKTEITLTLGYPAYEFHRLIPRRQPELAWNPDVLPAEMLSGSSRAGNLDRHDVQFE